MKLHLPKPLFTALLAVLTLAAPATLSLGSAAWGTAASYTEKTITYDGQEIHAAVISGIENTNMELPETLKEGYILTFSMSNGASGTNGGNNYFNSTGFSGDTAYSGDVFIYDDAKTESIVEGLIINNGSGTTKCDFTGRVFGNGDIHKSSTAPSNGTWYTFKGDMSDFVGDIKFTGENTNDKLIFIGNTVGSDEISNTSGSIEVAGATMLNTSITAKNFKVKVDGDHKITTVGKVEGNGESAVSTTLTATNLTVDSSATLDLVNGSLTSSGAFTNSGSVKVGSGASLTAEGTFTSTSGTVSVAENGTLSLGAATHSIGTLTASGTVSLAAGGTLTLGTAAQTIQKLQLAQNSTLQGDFDSNYRTVTITQLDLATGAMASVQTQDADHNGTYDILSLKGEQASLLLKNASSETNTTRFNLGGSEESNANTFTGHIYLIANQSTTTKRSAAINIKDGSAASGAVIHMLGISGATNSNLGLGIETDTVVAGINSTAAATINSVEYSSPTVSTIVAGSIDRTDDTHVSTASSAVTLTINVAENSSYDTNATVKDNLNLTKTGLGSQTFSGDLSAFNGSITVTDGSLTLGTEGQSGTMGLGGTINVSSEAALHLYNSFTIVDLAKLATKDDVVTYSDGVHGYVGATYILVKNAGTTTVGSDITVNNNNNSYTLNAGVYTGENVTFSLNGESGDYYVNADVNDAAVVYNTGSSSAIASDATTGIILNGGNLDMRTSLNAVAAENNGITAYKNATINLNGNAVTLEKSELSINETVSVTLTGSGVYNLGSVSSLGSPTNPIANVVGVTVSSLQNETNWKGTVKLTGTLAGGDLNDLGNAASTIELAGISGHLIDSSHNQNQVNEFKTAAYGATSEITPCQSVANLKLENTTSNNTEKVAFDLNNGYSASIYEFSGNICGAGSMKWSKSDVTDQMWIFSGDVSKWNGQFYATQGSEQTIRFTKAATSIATSVGVTSGALLAQIYNAADVTVTGIFSDKLTTLDGTGDGTGTLKLQIDNKNHTTTFKESVSVDELAITEDSTVVFNNQVSVSSTLILGSTATITGKDSGTVSMANVKMNATGISSADTTGATPSSIDGAVITQLAQDASFTIEDMTLLNTTITAATPTTQVKLQNVTASDVVLAKGKFTMGETAQVGTGGSGSTGNDFTTSLLSGITLSNTDEGAGSTLVVDLGDLSCVSAMGPGKYNLSITLRGFTMGDHTQGLLFAADSWLGKLLSAQGATAYVSGAVETPASVSEGGSDVSVSYSAATDGDGSNVGRLVITINGLNVPEPASATLGLAALMMLCARRRRK